jgi:citrate synthase
MQWRETMEKIRGHISELVKEAAARAREETQDEPEAGTGKRVKWPLECHVGPGLEGAVACETRVGYVNGTKGRLIYRGYDVFDLCEHSNYEEVCYLLLYGRLPTANQMARFNDKLVRSRFLPKTMRTMMGFPVEEMNPMAAMRLGTNFMRQKLTWRDGDSARPASPEAIASDEDTVGIEEPHGERNAAFEFKRKRMAPPEDARPVEDDAASIESCIHLISGMATIAAAVKRLREDQLPVEPRPELSHAANLLYMMTGQLPSPEEERVMDVALILHADHGMNASTFASVVVASTLSDIYFSIGAGIAALNGPLHGGANEQVLLELQKIGGPEKVEAYVKRAVRKKRKIMGFGHRVYKAYDPRARILGPLADYLCERDPAQRQLLETARELERVVLATFGTEKRIFPNVDFYSGLVYSSMGIPADMFTPLFAVSRVAGWSARVLEYLQHNRIFRPRAQYIGKVGREYMPFEERKPGRKRG